MMLGAPLPRLHAEECLHRWAGSRSPIPWGADTERFYLGASGRSYYRLWWPHAHLYRTLHLYWALFL